MGRKKKFGVKTFTITVITLTLLAISLFPYYYMVLQSFTAWDQVDKVMVPHGFTLRSYEYLIGKRRGATNSMMWVRALVNSFLVAFPTAIISVIIGLCNGYSVCKLKFKGNVYHGHPVVSDVFPDHHPAGAQVYDREADGEYIRRNDHSHVYFRFGPFSCISTILRHCPMKSLRPPK